MALKAKFACEECAAERKEANHWFAVLVNEPSSQTTMFSNSLVGIPILFTWDQALQKRILEEPGVYHYCGQHCLMTALQRWMDTGSIMAKGSAA